MKKSLIWEFSTDEMPHTSTLYGTIHLGTLQCMAHWEKIEKKIEEYSHIFTESSLYPEDLRYLQPFMLLEEDVQLHQYISTRRWSKMRKTFLKYCGLDIDDYRMFKPLFIMAQIQSQLVGANGIEALDYKIWTKAVNEGRTTLGIESAQEQVRILQSLDITQQYQNLVQMSKRITKTRRNLQRLLNAYAEQDIMSLYQMSKASLGRDRPVLIRNRNHIMADRIINFHNLRPSFFSFGAGHLAGGQGVLRLLKKKGAIVRPI